MKPFKDASEITDMYDALFTVMTRAERALSLCQILTQGIDDITATKSFVKDLGRLYDASNILEDELTYLKDDLFIIGDAEAIRMGLRTSKDLSDPAWFLSGKKTEDTEKEACTPTD